MDGAKEVACRLVVARCDGAVLLETGEEVLDQVASLVQVLVIAARRTRGVPGRNDHRFACSLQRLDHPGVGVIGFVGNDGGRRRVLQQHIGTVQIVGLSGRQVQTGRVAKRIDRSVDLGAQATATTSDGLMRAFFAPLFRAPALCWWALTMVESIKAYSLSASAASVSRMRRHTPD